MSTISRPEARAARRGGGGFSLVELMVVLVLVAVGILALAGVQTHSFTDVHSSGRATRALDLAEMRMEVARGAGYLNAVSDSGVTDSFNWRTIIDSTDVTDTGLRRATITVWWTDNGRPQSVQLTNLLAAR